MNEKTTKRSVYFYLGLIVALIGLALIIYNAVYYTAQYRSQLEYYVSQGYEESVVKESIQLLPTVLPNVTSIFAEFGMFAAVLFGINSILTALALKTACAPTVSEAADDEPKATEPIIQPDENPEEPKADNIEE